MQIETTKTITHRAATLTHSNGQVVATLSQEAGVYGYHLPVFQIEKLVITSPVFQDLMQGLIELADLNVKWTAAKKAFQQTIGIFESLETAELAAVLLLHTIKLGGRL